MKPPDSAEIFETSTSKYWFEGHLLCVVSKKAERPDEKTQKKEIEEFQKRIGNKKVCAIMDVGESTPTPRAERKQNVEMLPKLFKAIAFIIKNPATRFMAQLYLGALNMPFPVKMFSTEEEAKEWIKTKM
ncbi:MAG: STAS/SEC14 domain-containing protein [Saprospiraceae bacterium]